MAVIGSTGIARGRFSWARLDATATDNRSESNSDHATGISMATPNAAEQKDFAWSELFSNGQTHFFKPATQFCTSVSGSFDFCSRGMAIKKCCPSAETSYK